VDRDGVVETFLAYLRDHNLPVTQQRIDIAKVLLGSDRHLSVEDLAGELQQPTEGRTGLGVPHDRTAAPSPGDSRRLRFMPFRRPGQLTWNS